MQILWHGLGCVRLQAKETSILVDPFPATDGLSAPRLQANLFLFTDPTDSQSEKISSQQGLVVNTPGEYEVQGIMIRGIPVEDAKNAGPAKTIFLVTTEGLTVALCGQLSRMLTEEELQHLNHIDVLCVPVGGKPVLEAEQAAKLISEIEPRVVIPTYFKVAGHKTSLTTLEKFSKEMGLKNISPQEKVRLVKKELPEEEMHVIVLKP